MVAQRSHEVASLSPTSASGNEDMILYSRKYIHLCILWACLLVCLIALFIVYFTILFSPTHIFLSVDSNGRTQPCTRICEQERNFANVGQRKRRSKGLDNWTNTQTCAAYAHSQRKREERKARNHAKEERGKRQMGTTRAASSHGVCLYLRTCMLHSCAQLV